VIFVGSYGFWATAKIASKPNPHQNWRNRYGASLTSLRLIEPGISLPTIRRHVPDLSWAIYPRSITTPGPEVAVQVRALISMRRKTRLPDIDDDALDTGSIDELRRVALLSARSGRARQESHCH
jgi:hypothetical protein